MSYEESAMQRPPQSLGVFHLTCWVLGAIAFLQLTAVGVAMGLNSRAVAVAPEPEIVERIVTEYRTLPGKPQTVVVEKPVYIEREVMVPAAVPAALPPRPPSYQPEIVDVQLSTPPIANPTVERLVEEARGHRVAGDSARAMLKLDEAATLAPDDANVLYQFAEVFEQMGLYDQAADKYQQVFTLGTMGAGSLYELAALKLTQGIEQPADLAAQFALGRVRVFEDKSYTEGQRVILTIPVTAGPSMTKSALELERALELQVNLYDRIDNGPPLLRDDVMSTFEERWVTPPIDWQDGGEELLRVIYQIPYETGSTRHLLGQRKYFGQVVELFYDGEVLDRLASPRRLAKQVSDSGNDSRSEDIFFYPDNYVPDDFNFENPLLPPLPE